MIHGKSRGFRIAAYILALASHSQAAQFIPLGDFPEGAFHSVAAAISQDGSQVAGSGSRLLSDDVSDAFLWQSSTGMVNLQILPIVSSPLTYVQSLSDNGVVVGWLRHDPFSATSFEEPFRWSSTDGFVNLGHLPGAVSTGGGAYDVSADGDTIIGTMDNGNGQPEAFVWTAETGAVGIGDLPGRDFFSNAEGVSSNGLVITGNSSSAAGTEAFRWTAEAGMTPLGILPDGQSGFATAISSDGSTIVGWANTVLSGSGGEAFRWTEDGGMQPLGDLPGGGFSSFAFASSADGSVVLGTSIALPFEAEEPHKAFVWDEAHGMRDLQDVLKSGHGLASELENWQLFMARDISDDGLSIVGTGINPDGNTEAWLVRLDRPLSAPEPAALGLLAIAGGILSVVRRRPVGS